MKDIDLVSRFPVVTYVILNVEQYYLKVFCGHLQLSLLRFDHESVLFSQQASHLISLKALESH